VNPRLIKNKTDLEEEGLDGHHIYNSTTPGKTENIMQKHVGSSSNMESI
jgi:hypothetical protein